MSSADTFVPLLLPREAKEVASRRLRSAPVFSSSLTRAPYNASEDPLLKSLDHYTDSRRNMRKRLYNHHRRYYNDSIGDNHRSSADISFNVRAIAPAAKPLMFNETNAANRLIDLKVAREMRKWRAKEAKRDRVMCSMTQADARKLCEQQSIHLYRCSATDVFPKEGRGAGTSHPAFQTRPRKEMFDLKRHGVIETVADLNRLADCNLSSKQLTESKPPPKGNRPFPTVKKSHMKEAWDLAANAETIDKLSAEANISQMDWRGGLLNRKKKSCIELFEHIMAHRNTVKAKSEKEGIPCQHRI